MQDWQIQAACESYGYDGIWDVPEKEMDMVMGLAELLGD